MLIGRADAAGGGARAAVDAQGARSSAGARALAAARCGADLLAVCPAFLIAYAFAGAELEQAAEGAAAYAALLVLTLARRGLYRPPPSVLSYQEIAGVVRGALGAGAAFGALLYVVRPPGHAAGAVAGAVALAALLIPIARRAVMAAARACGRRGRLAGSRVLICGAGRAGRFAFEQVVHAAYDGRRVVGFLDDTLPVGTPVRCRIAQSGAPDAETVVLGRPSEWARLSAEQRVDVLLITAPSADPERTMGILRAAVERGVRAAFVPDTAGVHPDLLEADAVGALPVLHVADLRAARAPAGKRAFDIVGAATLLVLTLPVWLLASLAVRLTSPGSVFFVQDRVGRSGRRFRMYKFRTMRRDADPYALSPAQDAHPKITRVGRFLRATGLDELPQLLNVLRGDMSLVGPRPEMPFIVATYTDHERQRLLATPGLTGVWQLSPDRHAQIHEHVEHDLFYVRHQSLLLDVLVLFETFVFTASIVGRRLGAGLRGAGRTEAHPGAGAPGAAQAREARSPDGAPAMVRNEERAEGYALVALDQRGERMAGRWEAWLAWVGVLARRWPVKVLAARGNAPALDAALASAGAEPAAYEYVPYGSREQLRRLCQDARVVVTDLPHVADWARDAGVQVVSAPDQLHVGAPWAVPDAAASTRPSAASPTAPATAPVADLGAVAGLGARSPRLGGATAPSPQLM